MNIPLPKALEAGGDYNAAEKVSNALTKQKLENEIKKVEAQYAPQTTMATAASKLAYANLMGPQFLAKLMGNSDVVANSPQLQDPSTIDKLYAAGSGKGTGNSVINSMGSMGSSNSGMPSAPRGDGILNALLSALMGDQSQQTQSQAPSQNQNPFSQQQSNPMRVDTSNLPQQAQQKIAAMQPGDSYQIPASDIPALQVNPTTYPEKAGNFKGVIKEGEEAGKIRADDIKELNQQVFNSETTLTTLDDIAKVISSPEFEEIRQVPLAGRHELEYYAKEGTPPQQQMVGKYYTLTGNLVKDASRDFAGSFRKGEQTLLEGMKPSPSDTIDTAKGKTESITFLLKMLKERSKMTADIMRKYHVDKGQAAEISDKTIDGQKIREKIHDTLNPQITVRNKKTGEVKTISGSEARKLGAANV